jgi:type II secretory pathway predicted ATPase ExeA
MSRTTADIRDTPSDATSLLAVLDPVKNEAVDYFRRTIYETPRPILITGAKGSGKTAVVKAIAATLEMDRNIFCGKAQLLLLQALTNVQNRYITM